MKNCDKNTQSTNNLPITDGLRKKQYIYIRYNTTVPLKWTNRSLN